MRSAIPPQNWRLTKAAPSSTDSMAAPCEAAMPRSLQSATRCCCGIDIGTQQQKAATISIANTTIRRPAEHRRRVPVPRGGEPAAA